MDILDTFDDFESFLELVSKPGLPGNPTESSSLQFNFTGTHSYQHALELAANGWPEGLARMEKIRRATRPVEAPESERLMPSFVEAGDEVDVGRFVAGELENMVEFHPVKVPAAGRIVRLVLNIAASSAVSSDSLFRKGASTVALVDAIENCGLRSEVWVCEVTTYSGHHCEMWVCVKKADQPAEMDRLAFTLAHPSMLRRLSLRWMEHKPNHKEYFGDCYGIPENSKHILPTDIYVEPMQYGFGNALNTDEDVTKFVNAMLDKYLEPVAA